MDFSFELCWDKLESYKEIYEYVKDAVFYDYLKNPQDKSLFNYLVHRDPLERIFHLTKRVDKNEYETYNNGMFILDSNGKKIKSYLDDRLQIFLECFPRTNMK